VRPGDEIQLGDTRIVVDGDDTGSETVEESTDTRYRGVRILGKCEHCGMPLPIPGPVRQLHCSHCQGLNRRSGDFWVRFFDWLDIDPQSSTFLGDQIDVRVAAPPADLEDDVFDAPEWVHSADVQVVYRFFGAVREGTGDAPGPLIKEAARPVVMSCPKCAAALEVTGDSERTVTCQYCQSPVYLPDPLWQRLHPVQQAAWWFIEYRGDPAQEQRAKLIRARNKAQVAAERRQEQENRQRAQSVELAASETEQPARGGVSSLGLFAAILLVIGGALLFFLFL